MTPNDSAGGRRQAFTMVECGVVAVLSMLVCGMAQAFSVSATASSNHTLGSEDASRAILLASELIGLDLRRAVVAGPADLVISGDHRQASFTMATRKYQAWNAPFETVTYRLERQANSATDQRLVRTDSAGRRCPGGCVLRDLRFQLRPQAAATPWRATVLVTLVAPITAKDCRTVSLEIPVSRGLPPPAYPWFGPEGGPR